MQTNKWSKKGKHSLVAAPLAATGGTHNTTLASQVCQHSPLQPSTNLAAVTEMKHPLTPDPNRYELPAPAQLTIARLPPSSPPAADPHLAPVVGQTISQPFSQILAHSPQPLPLQGLAQRGSCEVGCFTYKAVGVMHGPEQTHMISSNNTVSTKKNQMNTVAFHFTHCLCVLL
jgi:hypothetical protein